MPSIVNQLLDDNQNLEDKLKAKMGVMQDILKYTDHRGDCGLFSLPFKDKHCTCGLNALLRQLSVVT